MLPPCFRPPSRATMTDLIRSKAVSLRTKAPKPSEPVGEGTVPRDTPKRLWADLRGVQKTTERGQAKGVRDWSKITGITLHQTAVDFGTDPNRVLNLPVHGATLQDGAVVLLHEPTDYMWHGNSFNRRDIGIEVSCRACGIEGNPDTLWLPSKYSHLKGNERLAMAVEATAEQLESTKALVTHYIGLVRQNGGQIKYIHAHRQSSKSKISDPGSRIWQAVGLWAMEEYGLTAGGPKWSSGGTPLPDVWTGENNGVRYSWKVSGF